MWIVKEDNTGGTLTHIPTGTRVVVEGNRIARQDQNGKHLEYIVRAKTESKAKNTYRRLCSELSEQGLLFKILDPEAKLPNYPNE